MFASYGYPMHHSESNDLWRLLRVGRGLVTHGQVVADDEVTSLVFVAVLNLSVILDKLMVDPRDNLHSFLVTELSLSGRIVILDKSLRHSKMEAEDRLTSVWMRIHKRMDWP